MPFFNGSSPGCVGVGFVRRPISLLAEYTVLLRILEQVEVQLELLEIEGE